MSKKSLASSRTRLLPGCRYLAIPLLMFGFVPGVWAQPWDTTISFNGSGSLNDSANTYPGESVPVSVQFSSLAGSPPSTGSTTAAFNGGDEFAISSSLNVFADVSIPNRTDYQNNPVPGAFSITQPVGPRPSYTPTGTDLGLTLTSSSIATANSSPPFGGLFPPTSGTVYTGSDNVRNVNFFQDDGYNLNIEFNGAVTLTLGNTPTLTTTPDPSLPGDDFYSYTYADSVLEVQATIGGGDPAVDFTGPLTITTIATAPAPDSSPGLAGVLALLAVCAGGAWQKARTA
jgi:hypothetical protein